MEGDMRGRELAFLLIGLGTGLILAVICVVEFVLAYHHMFVVGIRLQPASLVLAVPFLLIIAGAVLLKHSNARR